MVAVIVTTPRCMPSALRTNFARQNNVDLQSLNGTGCRSNIVFSPRQRSHMSNASSASAVWTPVPLPPQVKAEEGIAKLPGTRLWYWDTGGKGPAVVLLHAASGSGAFWGYQQPVLAKAGYRVISYSRRGYLKSDAGDPNDPGIASEDLHNLAGFLGISKVPCRRPCRGRHRRDRLRALASRAAVEPHARLDHRRRHRQGLPRSLQHIPAGILRAAAEGFSGAQRDLSRGQSGRAPRRGARSRRRR